jgi:hypothetical protein
MRSRSRRLAAVLAVVGLGASTRGSATGDAARLHAGEPKRGSSDYASVVLDAFGPREPAVVESGRRADAGLSRVLAGRGLGRAPRARLGTRSAMVQARPAPVVARHRRLPARCAAGTTSSADLASERRSIRAAELKRLVPASLGLLPRKWAQGLARHEGSLGATRSSREERQ